MSGELSAEDRALIEQTRKANKTLSVFVVAVQERSRIPVESLLGIADVLVALVDTIRDRAARSAMDGAAVEAGSSWRLELEPSREAGTCI